MEYRIARRWLPAVSDVNLAINPVQIHGLVGESGSGKSTLGLAMMRYLARNARITEGTIDFDGADLVQLPLRTIEGVWGGKMGLVPQNPMDALNPSLKIARQMTELTRLHLGIGKSEARDRAVSALARVQIADPEQVIDRYPHQLSGGMLQRVMIAMAMSTRPKLTILDEPTTALDVTTQAVILDLIRDLIKAEKAAALYVSHDLGTVAQLCDFVTVLYAGEVMESAGVAELFAQPKHPYTAGLLACLPSESAEEESRLATIPGVAPSLSERGSACVFADRCPLALDKCRTTKPPLEETEDGRLVRCWRHKEVAAGTVNPVSAQDHPHEHTAPHHRTVLTARRIEKSFGEKRFISRLTGSKGSVVRAVKDVSVDVRQRSTFGLVGESGSGKTTLARALLALAVADSGEIRLNNKPIGLELKPRDNEVLRNLRIVFQNPEDALNPYQSVGQTLSRTLRKLSSEKRFSAAERRTHVEALLDEVGLSADYYDRRPPMLSGGEKQRVVIARAFASHPDLIIADEPTSSLDVSVQAVILNLLKDLRAEEGASYIVISHDLEVVAYLADHIAVMYLGEIVEQGGNQEVMSFPSHPYTEALLSAAPVPDPSVKTRAVTLDGDIPSPRNRPTGCPFHTRCPRKLGTICETTEPPVRQVSEFHEIRCHHEPDALLKMQSGGNK